MSEEMVLFEVVGGPTDGDQAALPADPLPPDGADVCFDGGPLQGHYCISLERRTLTWVSANG